VNWRRLLDDCAKHKVDLVLVWRLDRAFRSVLDAAQTLERLRAWRVGLRSYQGPWLDTTSPFGEALYYITVAYTQLERGILRERVKAGMERARREGRPIGRPPVTERLGFAARWAAVCTELGAGAITRPEAARRLKIGYASLLRLIGRESIHRSASRPALQNRGRDRRRPCIQGRMSGYRLLSQRLRFEGNQTALLGQHEPLHRSEGCHPTLRGLRQRCEKNIPIAAVARDS